ncbi:CaiB/BaiF CoA transferase family protein [Falsiroseomonas selenitidurans]|uniref:CoA transferase n=1 Tax=Falsiroseomonas selenitidurans TaxID=2716335 RepID=A0ABX1E8K0_9PROT|nr:CaiB/BaiF CoA-transferase family protein [Falsiroseomonas selenitidurans]NKC33519.1 CoA transferase [Falsiroseomonas selenitidurans]
MSGASGTAGLPLSGLRVLDLTVARAGPTCVRHLADWGAEVIRIAPPASEGGEIAGDQDGFDYQNLHRNKRALQIDLKTPEGLALFMRMAEGADVVIENMRAAVKFRLGVDYASVAAVNPRVVYGSISGFGQDGPYGHRAGVDQIAQAMGGLMSITGVPGAGLVRVGIPIADLTAGNLLALAVMMALFDRTKTGRGRWVHTSLLESMVFMLDFQASRWLLAGQVAGQAGNDHPTSIPTGVYPTKDRPIALAASSPRMWDRFCDALGKPDWKARPGWDSRDGRSDDRAAINAAISEVTATMPSLHWIEVLDTAGIPCGAINTIDQTFADPQVQHLQMAKPVAHPRLGDQKLVRTPINMADIGWDIRSPTPDANQHADAVLGELGLSPDEIDRLRAARAIR